ncbi:hypothetical protein CTI14_72515, partial [Methylobacterium radiotolerans]
LWTGAVRSASRAGAPARSTTSEQPLDVSELQLDLLWTGAVRSASRAGAPARSTTSEQPLDVSELQL